MRARRATVDDLEFVRELRNSNRHLMTRDTSEISQEEQKFWWDTAYPDLWIWEAYRCGQFDPVGYALFTFRNGRDWISLAVIREFRNHGLGTQIYRFRTPISAEIALDNWPSRRAAEKAGMRVVWMDDLKVMMERW